MVDTIDNVLAKFKFDVMQTQNILSTANTGYVVTNIFQLFWFYIVSVDQLRALMKKSNVNLENNLICIPLLIYIRLIKFGTCSWV